MQLAKKPIMKTNFLYIALLGIFFLACTADDDNITEPDFEGVKGIVVEKVPCHAVNNGLAYKINIKNIESIDWIITANLPDQYKESGLNIKFDMKNSSEGFGACVALYSSTSFYKISNISLYSQAGKN